MDGWIHFFCHISLFLVNSSIHPHWQKSEFTFFADIWSKITARRLVPGLRAVIFGCRGWFHPLRIGSGPDFVGLCTYLAREGKIVVPNRDCMYESILLNYAEKDWELSNFIWALSGNRLHYRPCQIWKMVVALYLRRSLVTIVAYSIVIISHEIFYTIGLVKCGKWLSHYI